jgi:hypothetical protein
VLEFCGAFRLRGTRISGLLTQLFGVSMMIGKRKGLLVNWGASAPSIA